MAKSRLSGMRQVSFFAFFILVFCASLFAQIEIAGPQQQRPQRGNRGAGDDKIAREPSMSAKEKAANEQMQRDLLARAYGMSKDLSESDRAFLLARLAQASTKVDAEKSKKWADEVFDVSAGLPADMSRNQNEMNAMIAIAENDPDHGLQLLLKMEPPAPRDDGRPQPDMRSGAAMMLFQKYWQKKGADGIEALQSTARQLGEAGNYPYMAMTPIIRSVGRTDKDKAQGLTNEALAYFSRRTKSDMGAQQLSMFLRTNREFIPLPMLKDILSQMVTDALDTKNDTRSNAVLATFSSGRGSATMTGAANLVLFNLLPMIKEIDPEWAKKVEAQSQELKAAASLNDNQASSGPSTNRVGIVMGAPGGNMNTANMMEEMKSREVDSLLRDDPQEAMKVAEEIHDPVIRAATDARLAGEVNKTDPAKAAEMVKSAREAMARATEPGDKLRILVGLAQAQAAMKDKAGFSATLDQAYAMGEELFRKSVDKSPTLPLMARPGFDLMSRLTMAGVKLDSTATIAHIDSVRMPVLQALLLVSAAQGLDPDGRPQDGAFRMIMRS
ncbi:MAG: hypothetical protein JWO13_1020 [Acidobacteriales bacterium]|nr:hypothetical protein [Terriglobales bacterium]